VKKGFLPAITHCDLLPLVIDRPSVSLITEDSEEFLTETGELLMT
jgi:hypothetical protein